MYSNDTQVIPAEAAFAWHLDWYEAQGYSEAYVNSTGYTIETESREYFRDGRDRYYAVYLTWDPDQFGVTWSYTR